jgi:hypothetical protein
LIDGIDHRGDKVLDVGTVERRDECASGRRQDLACDFVGFGARSKIWSACSNGSNRTPAVQSISHNRRGLAIGPTLRHMSGR